MTNKIERQTLRLIIGQKLIEKKWQFPKDSIKTIYELIIDGWNIPWESQEEHLIGEIFDELVEDKNLSDQPKDVLEFPHVRYVSIAPAGSTTNVYTKKYMGSDKNLTKGKVYQFTEVSYSPDPETPRKILLCAKDDNGKYIRVDSRIKNVPAFIKYEQ